MSDGTVLAHNPNATQLHITAPPRRESKLELVGTSEKPHFSGIVFSALHKKNNCYFFRILRDQFFDTFINFKVLEEICLANKVEKAPLVFPSGAPITDPLYLATLYAIGLHLFALHKAHARHFPEFLSSGPQHVINRAFASIAFIVREVSGDVDFDNKEFLEKIKPNQGKGSQQGSHQGRFKSDKNKRFRFDLRGNKKGGHGNPSKKGDDAKENKDGG
jgi:hypothetical protein